MSQQTKIILPSQIEYSTKLGASSLANSQLNIISQPKTCETSKLRQRFSPDLKHFLSYNLTEKHTKINSKEHISKLEKQSDKKNKTLLSSSTMFLKQKEEVNNAQNLLQNSTKERNLKKKVFSPIANKKGTIHSTSPCYQKNKKKIMSPKRNLIQYSQDQRKVHQISISSKQKSENRCPSFFKKNKIAEEIKKQVQFNSHEKLSNLTAMDFKFVKFLGQGTFGDVYLAIHKKTNSLFTIKRYRKDTISSHQLQQKFIKDIKLQSKISHPNIVKMYGFFDDQTFVYIIFQYMDQGNLWKLIQEKGGKISQNEITKKIVEINSALIQLHEKKLIHRDIKPQSILVCHNLCKLCDTQWIQGVNQKSQNLILCKQIDYTAPQALQGKQINSNFDVWGLGLVAYQLVTGKKLFNAVTQKGILRKIITVKKQTIEKQLPEHITKNLKEFIVQALNPVPTKRISSIQIQKLQIFKKHIKERKWLGEEDE